MQVVIQKIRHMKKKQKIKCSCIHTTNHNENEGENGKKITQIRHK